ARASEFDVRGILRRDFCGSEEREKLSMKAKLLSLSFLVVAELIGSGAVDAQTVAIKAGNVIDTATGRVAKDQVIVVEHGKIKSIGSGSTIPADAQVVDLSKSWVTPGLIDAHTHLTLSEVPGKAPF